MSQWVASRCQVPLMFEYLIEARVPRQCVVELRGVMDLFTDI